MSRQHKINRSHWDSQHIQALRHHLGLTQRELSDRLGTRQQTISEWETGMYQPRGTSATLLSIIAEQAKFNYGAVPPEKEP
jgi:DNA-binding transcriptional regulator YiaG